MAVLQKKCNKCTVVKSIDCFGKHKITKDGYNGICKSCNASKTRQFYISNKSEVLQKQKDRRQQNPTPYRIRDKKYRTKNRSQVSETKRRIQYKKRQNDDLYKLSCNIRSLISKTFKRKGFSKKSKTYLILGCDFTHFQAHLLDQFIKRYGRKPNENDVLEIDHIKPILLAKNESDILKLNHFTNLQWLLKEDHKEKTKLDIKGAS